jgi:hypothetical protein
VASAESVAEDSSRAVSARLFRWAAVSARPVRALEAAVSGRPDPAPGGRAQGQVHVRVAVRAVTIAARPGVTAMMAIESAGQARAATVTGTGPRLAAPRPSVRAPMMVTIGADCRVGQGRPPICCTGATPSSKRFAPGGRSAA